MRNLKIVGSAVGLLLLATPAFAQTTDVQAQINALLAQIKQLQALIAQLQGQAGSSAVCLTLQNNLYLDQTDAGTNGEVSKLQRFLGGRVTGYFGPATLQIVQKWQAGRGIVSSGDPDTTGFGYVGPKTRAAMACNTETMLQKTVYVPPKTSTPVDKKVVTTPSGGETENLIPSITVGQITTSAITGSYANLPKNSQIRLVGALTGQVFDGQSTVVWEGGSGLLSFPISSFVYPDAAYYLRVTDYYNPNTVIAQSNSFQGAQSTPTNPVVINSFSASPSSVKAWQPVVFSWSANLTAVDLAKFGGGCSVEGLTQNNVVLNVTPSFYGPNASISYNPTATATYTLRCYSSGKDESLNASKQVTVTVDSAPTNPVVINSFTASPTSVTPGQPVTFTWGSNLSNYDIEYYAGGCSVTALTFDNSQQINVTAGFDHNASGSVTHTPTLTSTYTLLCSSGAKDGSPMDSKQVTVTVN